MANRTLGRAVGNLLGGVSQQPANTRFLNAASESINAYPDLAQGLDKRPGSQFIAVGYAPAGVGNTVQAVGHFINRDSGEKYGLLLYRDGTGGVNWTPKAIDLLTGATVPIYSDTSGAALGTALNDYLRPAAADEQVSDETADIRLMTVGDTTFLLNRKRIAKMDTPTTAAQENKALIVVRAGAYGQKYAITIGGTTYQVDFRDIQTNLGDGLTPDGQVGTHSRYIGPDVILQRLLNDINLTAGFVTNRKSNVASVRKAPDTAFDIEPNDAHYTKNLEVLRGEVEAVNSLPLVAPHGFKVKVAGGNDADEDDFYAEFEAEAGSGFGRGEWVETVGWGVKYQVDAATMPHVFRSYVKSSVGTHPAGLAVGDPYFVFEPFTWTDRQAGDDDSNPIPSIFDTRLDAIGFHRGRLLLMSGESVVASEAGEAGNLFRTSVKTSLDKDRIDLTSQIRDASDFRAMVEHNERAVLFSDQSQVVLDSAGDVLAGRTAGLTVAGSATVDPDGQPVAAGGLLFVPFRRGQINGASWTGYSGVYQMRDTRGGQALRLDPVDITEQCPRYVADRVVSMSASTAENMLAVVTADRDLIYLYKWADSGDGARIQSAWQKIRLATSYAEATPPTILAAQFIESTLYLWTFRDSEGMGVVCEKVDFAPGVTDDDGWCQVRLDNRIRSDNAAVASIVLSGSDTVVTFNAGTWKRRGDGSTGVVYAVTADVAGQVGGLIYASDTPGGGGGGTAVVTFPGVDLTAKQFYIGVKYQMRHTVSNPYLEGRAADGGSMALVSGRTRVVRALVDIAEAADIKAEVAYSTVGGTSHTRQFLHSGTGAVDVAPFEGTKSIPVDARRDRYSLVLVNDSPFGGRINGIEYELTHHARSQRVG